MVKAKEPGPGVDPDPNGWKTAYVEIAKDVVANFETVLYVEVPKYDSEGKVQTPDGIINQLETLVPQIGYAKNIAYFAGGIKYYDANGTLQSIYPVSAALGLINYRAGAEGVMWNKGLCFISILIMCAIGLALMFVKQKPEKREAKKTQHTAPKKGW